MEPFGVVYLVTNLVTGLYYVGQTIHSIERRWTNHVAASNRSSPSVYFHRAIAKHGRENFSIEVLDTADSYESLNDKESLWIILLRSYDPLVGYNTTTGGRGRKPTKETVNKILTTRSKSAAWKKHLETCNQDKIGKPAHPRTLAAIHKAVVGNKWNVGKVRSQETRDKIAAGNRGKKITDEAKVAIGDRFRGNTTWRGRAHTPESREKMSRAAKARFPNGRKPRVIKNPNDARVGTKWSEATRESARLKREARKAAK